MSESALSLCRNDVLGGGMMPNVGECTSSAIRSNINVGDRFQILGGSSGMNSGEYITINGWDSSNNSGGTGHRGGNLFSATTKNDGIHYIRDGVKYGRNWGCQIGFKNKPRDDAEYAFLHGVCGLEFDWEVYTPAKNYSQPGLLMLLYGSRYDQVYCMPLIRGLNQLYPGATQSRSGDNLLGINGTDKKGRICIRGSSQMCDWVHRGNLIFLGLAIGFTQAGNQSIGEKQEFRMWNCRPMFSRDGMSSSYRAICPGKKYPWSEAINGSMAIA